tara:strand:- start:101 stop:775 length:675 start_codon:yes stop_codon:yes gene_type:complete
MISTKKTNDNGTESSFVNKSLQPGNTVIKVDKIYLEDFPFGENAYNLILECQGQDLENFDGFFIDKDDESKGKYKCQVGRIKSSQWAYADKQLNDDVFISRDEEIVKFLRTLCYATDSIDWLDGVDGKYETIETLVEALNTDCPFKDKWLNVCIGGREYQNKAGYTAYDLFLPKFSKEGIPFAAFDSENSNSQIFTFNNDTHIKRKVVKNVDSFEPASKEDFEL